MFRAATMVEQALQESSRANAQSPAMFARHETFHPRFGWLKKGFDRASADPEVFLREDAPVRLGVGKNMVRSLRYWCSAFKLLQNDRPTAFGQDLLERWDPYLEDPASLWLLHWKLLEAPCYATSWHFAFNDFSLIEFTVEDLLSQLCDYRDRVAPRVVESSLRKDISCLLRMYTSQPLKGMVSEDSLDCPFAELGLIHFAGNARSYAFRIGVKPTLAAEIVIYACLTYAAQVAPGLTSLSIAKLLYDACSPGLIFRLTESALSEAIEAVGDADTLGITDVAGKLEFFFRGDPTQIAQNILNSYYTMR